MFAVGCTQAVVQRVDLGHVQTQQNVTGVEYERQRDEYSLLDGAERRKVGRNEHHPDHDRHVNLHLALQGCKHNFLLDQDQDLGPQA